MYSSPYRNVSTIKTNSPIAQDTPKYNSPRKIKLASDHKLLPKNTTDKKTLVLDLDETLVHSTLDYTPNADYAFNVPPLIRYKLNQSHSKYTPYSDQESMTSYFKCPKYTKLSSSLRAYLRYPNHQYANPLLDLMDPNKLISHRLYREHCVYYNRQFIKDLSNIGRDARSTIIIDNSPISYMFQQDNALPISTWIGEKNDNELASMAKILERLRYVNDVRQSIKKIVRNNEIIANLFEEESESKMCQLKMIKGNVANSNFVNVQKIQVFAKNRNSENGTPVPLRKLESETGSKINESTPCTNLSRIFKKISCSKLTASSNKLLDIKKWQEYYNCLRIGLDQCTFISRSTPKNVTIRPATKQVYKATQIRTLQDAKGGNKIFQARLNNNTLY